MTTFSTASRARLRHASAGPPARLQSRGREVIEWGCVPETGTTARTRAGAGGATVRLRGGGYVAPLRAEALRGAPPPLGRSAPLPQVGGPRRYAASMVAPAKGGLSRPPCRASSHRARSHSRALPPVASLRDGASATLECDLPRKDLGTYRMDGADRPSVPTSAHVKSELTVKRATMNGRDSLPLPVTGHRRAR